MDDPAFQAPQDPLRGSLNRTRVIYRDLPLVTIQHTWSVAQVRSALAGHVAGMFESSGQLVDSIIADDRVTATLNSRLSGLFSRELRHSTARGMEDSREAREVRDAWAHYWHDIVACGALQQILAYQVLFGFWPAQLVWSRRTTKWGDLYLPIVRPWHARYTYYHWDIRRYVALTMDGPRVIHPGDGKWLLHAPRGEYRAWMWGGIRAIAEAWLLRHFALRDMARFSEVHGMPIRKGIAPAAGDPQERDLFAQQLANLGQETTILVSRGVDGQGMDYDLELVEASDAAWEVFPGLVDRCDMAIVLALLFQNLTTEIKGGSFAAASAHMDIRQQGIADDNSSLRTTIHEQIARAFAHVNWGDADLAPWTDWDVTPREDYDANARRFYSFGQSVQILRQGGVAFGDAESLRRFAREQFGLTLPDTTTLVEPDAGSGAGATPRGDDDDDA